MRLIACTFRPPWNHQPATTFTSGDLPEFEGVGSVSTPAEDYRQRAAECLRLSRRIEDLDVRAIYVTLAQSWIALAVQVEGRRGHDPPMILGDMTDGGVGITTDPRRPG